MSQEHEDSPPSSTTCSNDVSRCTKFWMQERTISAAAEKLMMILTLHGIQIQVMSWTDELPTSIGLAIFRTRHT